MSTSEQLSPPAISNKAATVGRRAANLESWKNAAGYLATLFLVLAAMTITLHLWKADLRVPFHYDDDNLMNLMFLQNMSESGWIYDGPRIGAPDGQDLRDFPVPDVLHLGVLKLMSCASHNLVLVLNLYALLCFPLIALSAYFVLRRLGLSRLAALTPAILYACLPYHYERMSDHVFLSAYYLLPLMIWLLVRVYLGRYPVIQTDADGKPRWRFWSGEAVGAVLICVLTGLAGVYYAFFSCFFLVMVGVKTALRERRWTPLLVSSFFIALISGVLIAALVPNLIHVARHGKNAGVAGRLPAEADQLGLSIGEMLTPIEGHRVRAFEKLRERFLAPPRVATIEFRYVPIGLAASLGFLYLLARFLWRPRDRAERTADALAYLTLVSILLGAIGGFGSCFNLYVTPMIRCYNRISIFIAFFALAGLFLLLQHWITRYDRNAWTRILRYAGLVALLVLGVLDQTSAKTPPFNFIDVKREYLSDVDFGRRMEAVLPAGAMVYQMPYIPFPEGASIEKLHSYQMLRPYFHTQTLRFTYGTVRNRAASDWQTELADQPLARTLEVLAFTGFRGVYLDRAGYADSGAKTEAELSRLLSVEPIISRSGRQTFFDMTNYVDALHAQYSEDQWNAKTETATHPLRLEWSGAYEREKSPDENPGSGVENTWRWCGAKTQLTVRNTLNRGRHVILKMAFGGWQDKPAHLMLDGDLCRRELSLTAMPQPITLEFIVPPGEHRLTFTCDGPRLPSQNDLRELVFRVSDLKCRIDGE